MCELAHTQPRNMVRLCVTWADFAPANTRSAAAQCHRIGGLDSRCCVGAISASKGQTEMYLARLSANTRIQVPRRHPRGPRTTARLLPRAYRATLCDTVPSRDKRCPRGRMPTRATQEGHPLVFAASSCRAKAPSLRHTGEHCSSNMSISRFSRETR